MGFRFPGISTKYLVGVAIVLIALIAWGSSDRWFPIVQERLFPNAAGRGEPRKSSGGSVLADHQPKHLHNEFTSLALTPQARRNIGLTDEKLRRITLEEFERTIVFPAMVVERPARTHVEVAAPVTGVVTGVSVLEGEAVRSGRLMFSLRLTHEDLVRAQTEFLRTLGKLDVEMREIARLEKITAGVVAGKVLLEREYERMKLEAELRAFREALRLHGLSETQLERIETTRRLVRELRVFVPLLHDDASLHDDAEEAESPIRPVRGGESADSPDAGGTDHSRSKQFVVTQLNVHIGHSVQAGETLCTLAEYSELYLEGRAFEDDADELIRAAEQNWSMTAVLQNSHQPSETIRGLKLVFLANQIDPVSRALRFYVRLPNRVIRKSQDADGRLFLDWKFKPGQRLQLLVPVEKWKDRIVLPVDAVAQEGAETFVFQQNGDHFDRRAVHVEYQDQFWAVIANDGSLFPGDTVAFAGAHQMQMALKNKAGGGVDPHAGHNH